MLSPPPSLTGTEMVDLFAALHGVRDVRAASDAFIKVRRVHCGCQTVMITCWYNAM